MGERGMQFFDKTIPVNEHIIKRLNDIFDFLICKDYDDIRKYRLVEPIYPRDIMVAAKLSPALDERNSSRDNAIPEFLKYNIMERDVRNVY